MSTTCRTPHPAILKSCSAFHIERRVQLLSRSRVEYSHLRSSVYPGDNPDPSKAAEIQ
jgi:hypothetical protein